MSPRASVVLGTFLCALALCGGVKPPDVILQPVTAFRFHLEEGSFVAPRGIFYDPVTEEVWVADTRNHLVAAFTTEGMPIYTARPGDEVREPARLVVQANGDLLVLDNDRTRVAVLDWRGEYVGPLALPGLPDRPVLGAIALDGDGNLYLGENSDGEVLVYGADRRLRLRFGGWGADEGQFQAISDIAIDQTRIVVIDQQATAVQIFDRKGNLKLGFGEHAMGAANFSLPQGVAIDSSGRIIVVDALRHDVKVFAPDGRLIGRFGGYGNGPGQVSFPSGIAIDSQDRIYIVEQGGSRVQVFREVETAAGSGRRKR